MSKHLTGKAIGREVLQSGSNDVFGLVSFPSWRNLALGGRKRTLLAWGCIACIPGLILGLVAFLSSVGPLEKRLLELEAHGLARDIDSVVKVRMAAIRIAMGDIGLDELSEAGRLDDLLSSFRRTFRDFLSVEVLDKRGEVLAMAGELPLAQARRFSRTDESARTENTVPGRIEGFQDNPKSKDFFITVKHSAPDKTVWYSRTRFTRDSVEQVLSSGDGKWQASLSQSPREAVGKGSSDTASARSSNWWGGLDIADAHLETPGWILRLDKPSKRVLLSKGPIIFVALILIVAVMACLYRRLTSDRRSPLPGLAAATRPVYSSPEATQVRAAGHRERYGVKASVWNDADGTDRNEYGDHDVWTPRNVPIGIVESQEPDPSDSEGQLASSGPATDDWDDAPQESGESAELARLEEESTAGSGILPVKTEIVRQSSLEAQDLKESDTGASSIADGVDDFPETIELTWFEPADFVTDSADMAQTGSSRSVSEAKTRRVAIPESLEVSWSEQASENPKDSHVEPAKDQSPRHYA